MARIGLVAALVASLLVTVVGHAQADKRVALIIGNSAYVNVPRLANPASDARLMAETLRSLGFSLVGNGAQLDLDDGQFRKAVQDFGTQLQGAEVGLFYYAGHGVQVRGANYLVPVGANPIKESDVDFQMLDSSLVLRQMADAGTKLNLVILDACRNNPFGGRGLRATESGLAQMRAPEGTLISFATQPGSVARDGTDGNSPYTKALAQAMRKPGLDIFRTFNEVGLAVASATAGAQQPWVSLSPITGEFYFAGAPASVARTADDPAERAWGVTQNTTSVAVLEDFIRQFSSTIYGSMARARLEELKKSQVAVIEPPPPASACPASNPVIARVNGVDIRVSDLTVAEEEFGGNLKDMSPDQKRENLTQILIDIILMVPGPEQRNLSDCDNVKRRIALARYRVLMEERIKSVGEAALTDQALHQVYDDAVKQMAGEQEVRARHILVPTEEEAKAIAVLLKKGADFAKLAKERSKDTAAPDGDLGYFTKEQMVPEFAEAAFKMAKGQISSPIKTQFGWHIIKVEDKRTKPVPPFDDIKAQLANYVTRRAQADFVEKLRATATIERLEKSTTSNSPPSPPGAPTKK